MPDFFLLLPDGDVKIAAEPGESVLAAVLRAGQKLQTVCKGRGMCGACRVRVDEAFIGRLKPPVFTETRLLNYLGGAANNRLACQILLDDSLSGMGIMPDPIIPKTVAKENTI
jgi:ferredoxin